MVSHEAAVNSRKRKKTTDMADSPPKRVTRARAKATEDSGLEVKTTKITTASARIAAASKAPAKTTPTTKRKTRADDTKIESIDQGVTGASNALSGSSKARGRPKKAVDAAETDPIPPDVLPKPRGRPSKSVVKVAEDITQPTKSSGRTKILMGAETPKAINATTEVDEPAAAVKVTRARSVRAKPQAAATAAAKPSTLKKKFTFQENTEEDKENVAILSETARKVDPKPAGLKAKPLRKGTTTKTSVHRKKATNLEDPIVDGTPKSELPQPLSAKKVTQVAKNSSVSSEDELCGEKSPLRTLNRSPAKPPISVKKDQSRSVSDLKIAPAPVSPTRLVASSIMASPARCLPPSPFKDALKQSPKRVALPSTIAAYTLSPQKSSPKSSLLLSPARRPMSSFKLRNSAMKTGTVLTASHGFSSSVVSQSFKFPAATPSKLFSSPLRPGQSVQRSVKVHKLTPVGQEARLSTDIECTEHGSCDGDRTEDTPSKLSVPGGAFEVLPTMLQSPLASVDEPRASEPRPELSMSQEDSDEHRNTTPPGERDENAVDLFNVVSPVFRYTAEESDSEDELQPRLDFTSRLPLQKEINLTTDVTPTPAISLRTPRAVLGRHSLKQRSHTTPSNAGDFLMTPLALQLSSWMASSPDKKSQIEDQGRPRGIFSAFIPRPSSGSSDERQRFRSSSSVKLSLFDDEMLVRDQENATFFQGDEPEQDINMMITESSEDSKEVEEYGDENTVPIDPQLLVEQHIQQPLLETVTPTRLFRSNPREIHTVSKVPLRPAAEDSPLKIPRKRIQSISGPHRDMKEISRPSIGRSNTVISYSIEGNMTIELQSEQSNNSVADEDPMPFGTSTPSNGTWSTLATPIRNVRKGALAQILRGAVIFVDVHTTEGADASGTFVELLTQMGAKCIKQWAWNPRASSGKTSDSTTNDQDMSTNSSTPSGKVGITHVVYKDGGKRTLEKVRESKGLVLCVGVSWVLEYVAPYNGFCAHYLTLPLAVSARISGLMNLNMLSTLPSFLEVAPVGASRWSQECY